MFTELLAMVVGQNAAESLRGSKGSRNLLPQERTDAFSGVASAFLGIVGLAIGMLATLGGLLAFPGKSFAALAIVAGIGFGCSCAAYHFGRRVPHVTDRFLGMAKFAVMAASAGMVLAVLSLVLAAASFFS